MFFSQDGTATIAHIIPTMDCIDGVLHDTGTTLSVKHALIFACKLLDKYYSKSDLSNFYQITMCTFFVSLYIHFVLLTITLSSPSPPTQTQVFSATQMGEGLDSNG